MTLPASRYLALALGALVVAAGSAMTANSAVAADLYSEDAPPPRSSAYDDPRYADLYGQPTRRVETYRSESYREREYEAAPPAPRAYAYGDTYADRYAGRRNGCASKDEISGRLESNGWRGFHNPQVIDRDTATVDAQRPNGRPFRLEVDRCNGNILAERPLERPRYSDNGEGYYGGYDRRPLRSY